ncbi:hypothetical protein Tco_0608027 [Tanacetum coccineum]
MMTGSKFDIEKFHGMNDFGLLQLEDVLATLNSRELQKMTEAKGDGGEGFYVRRRFGQRDMEQGIITRNLKVVLGLSGSGADGECRVRGTSKVQVQMRDGSSFVLDNASPGVWYVQGFLGRGYNHVYISSEQGHHHQRLDLRQPIDMLGFFGWLARIKQGMLKPVKVKCIFLGYCKGISGNKLWRLDDVTSKVVLYRNTGFNEIGEYKKTFIGSGVGTSSVQVLQGVEFEVEPYKEDSNEAAFAVVAVEKIYAHESLTFNNTVACEAISKWKAGLKDDMNAQSDMYVLSNGCRKCSDDSNGYYWEYTPAKENVLGMEIVRDQSGTTLRVSQFRFTTKGWYILCWRDTLYCHWRVVYQGTVMWKRMILATSWEDRSLSWVDQSQAVYMTLTEAAKEAIWLKGLAIESGFELKIVAGIATGALSKAIPGSRFQH